MFDNGAKRRIRREKRKMRLIDAEKLLEVMERDSCYPEAYKRLVDEQPTAYKLDKVMEDLEKYAYSDICSACPRCRNFNVEDIRCEQCGALGALELVKRGGYDV